MDKPETESKTTGNNQPYFRDMLHTVDDTGKRKWIFPKRPKGKLYNYRSALASLLLGFFFLAPFVKVNGEPFMLLNIFERKFILFGQVFWPQDFHLIAMSIIALVVFIILFTVVFGRVFCGWVCPQTIFLEFFYRQIEYLIEGDFLKQKKLAAQEWDAEKIFKKTLKHVLFIAFSLLIAGIFLSYIVGAARVGEVLSFGPESSAAAVLFMLGFAGFFYFIYSAFREQVCILLCPYGRLQGVLLDEKSIVVAYDYKRGEPRGTFRSSENRGEAGKGDCIDCLNCVHVCPTGIDVRNGTQLECINCTACIDACNSVMKRVKLPAGLIRFDSEKGISSGVRKIINARSLAYSAFLSILLIVISALFISRDDVEVTIMRVPGSIYQEYGADKYSNIYKIQLVNKTRNDYVVELNLTPRVGEVIFLGNPITAVQGELSEATFLVVIPHEELQGGSTNIALEVVSEGRVLTTYKTNFLGPSGINK